MVAPEGRDLVVAGLTVLAIIALAAFLGGLAAGALIWG